MSQSQGAYALSNNRKKKFKFQSEWFYGYLFAAPVVLGTLVFSIGPILYSFYLSFTKWDGMQAVAQFIAFKNYIDVLKDAKVYREFWNTMYYTFGTVPINLLLSLLVATALNSKIMKAKGTFRVIYFLPNVTMPVAIAMVWQWLYNSKIGLVNMFLGLFGIKGPMWVGDAKWIMPAIIIVSIWGGIGYNMVIFLAGLQNIPAVLYEAAEIDGAKGMTRFWKITFPLMTPTIFFLLTMAVMDSLMVFDIIFMFGGATNATGGGPLIEATRSMVYGVYQNAFTFLRFGYASAEAVVLFAIIMIVTLIQFLLQKKWVIYD